MFALTLALSPPPLLLHMADTTPKNNTREVIIIHSDASDIESGQVTTKSDSPRKRKRKKKQASQEEEGSEARSSSGREARRERRKKLRLEEQASGSGSRDSNSERRRRSRSPPGRSLGPLDDSKLFFLDLEPVAVQNVAEKTAQTGEEGGPSKLLLPSHVQVLGSVPVEILPPSSPDSEDEDYIDYLDYDDRKVCCFGGFSWVLSDG